MHVQKRQQIRVDVLVIAGAVDIAPADESVSDYILPDVRQYIYRSDSSSRNAVRLAVVDDGGWYLVDDRQQELLISTGCRASHDLD